MMSVDKEVRHCDSIAIDACKLCENSLCIYRAHLATEASTVDENIDDEWSMS